MSLERDETVNVELGRSVRLAGRDFVICPLSLRQIVAIADYLPKIGKLANTISGENVEALCEVVWNGVRRAYPRMTREEFFDLDITIAELVGAIPVVLEQAGLERAA